MGKNSSLSKLLQEINVVYMSIGIFFMIGALGWCLRAFGVLPCNIITDFDYEQNHHYAGWLVGLSGGIAAFCVIRSFPEYSRKPGMDFLALLVAIASFVRLLGILIEPNVG